MLAIDLFIFMYFEGGINFCDIVNLTKKNIINNRTDTKEAHDYYLKGIIDKKEFIYGDYLSYNRKKTNRLITLPLEPIALKLINKYADKDNPYLFPILNAFHKTEQQKANRINKVIRKINKCLKFIGKELDIPIDLTTYVSRHSFATVLKRSGAPTGLISEALGHSNEKVTQTYLDSFGNEQMRDAMKNLLSDDMKDKHPDRWWEQEEYK
jgi:integrase